MKKFFIIIAIIVILPIFIWMFPVKLCSPIKDEYITKAENFGNIAILCHVDQVTGPLWEVKSAYNSNVNFSHIDIIGNTPDKYLKNPIHCYNADFLFIGNFPEEGVPIFEVEEWKFASLISRDYEMHPFYPPYGINIFEKRYK